MMASQTPAHKPWVAALGRRIVIGVPFAWLLAFFMMPFLIVLGISVSEMGDVRPRSPLSAADGTLTLSLRFAGYRFIGEDALYLMAFLASLKVAALTTVLCLLIGYPFAYFMARARASVQPALVMLVMLPFWTSFLLRVYAWKGLLSDGGWGWELVVGSGLDQALHALGMIAAPGKLMNTPFSLVLGMVYTYLPFMILPLFGTLSKMDARLLEAAHDLGARPWTAFWTVTVPLSRAGIVAGSMLVFIPSVGEYVIPELLGGPQTLMIGRVMWDEFFANNDWPMAASVAVVLVGVILLPLTVFNKVQAQQQVAGAAAGGGPAAAGSGRGWLARAWLGAGFLFLYLPILALVLYSFNDSTVPNAWRGFTLKWYAALAQDREMLAGLWLSLKIALLTATGSVVLGLLAAFSLVKYRRFRGRTVFTGMVQAPLVMPEVVVGLSLLLMMVSLQRATESAFGVGWPERGVLTIWLGHLLIGMAYATVVLQSRLVGLDPQLEEAARDLGARPWQVFWLVTLPMIGQSLAAAWLLTFTLSLDDVVLSAFLSGPGSTTMPLVIFSRAKLGLSPSVNAVATVIVVLVALGVATAGWLIAHAQRQRDAQRALALRNP
jgi:putrescine transport system permease protein